MDVTSTNIMALYSSDDWDDIRLIDFGMAQPTHAGVFHSIGPISYMMVTCMSWFLFCPQLL